MKDLSTKNKFRYKLEPGGYKAAMLKWAKKEQELHETGIPDSLEGCMVRTRNWIWGRSRTYDSRWLITSSSEVTSVVEKAKTLTTKEKTGDFKSQWERDQLSAALKNEEHCGRTRTISSIASWKDGFVDLSHMYKKLKTHEIAHNVEETFEQQFFNFMRKNPQYVVQVPILKINLNLSPSVQPFASSSAGSAPNRDKDNYLVDDIKDPPPCTLMYVKGRTSRAIKVAEATVMPSSILHGWNVPAECAVVEVTTMRGDREFEDLDYPDEDEGIEKLVDAKETFILWPRKDIIVKTHSSSIVSPQNTEVGGTPTSNMLKPAQFSHTSVTLPTQNHQDPELQEGTARRSPSPVKESQGPELQDNREHRPPSPPAWDQELQGNKERRPPSPPARDQELQGNKERRSPSPLAQDQEIQGNKEHRLPSPPTQDQEL
jgi:hypothetical protein